MWLRVRRLALKNVAEPTGSCDMDPGNEDKATRAVMSEAWRGFCISGYKFSSPGGYIARIFILNSTWKSSFEFVIKLSRICLFEHFFLSGSM
jgi:hypothetical protein